MIFKLLILCQIVLLFNFIQIEAIVPVVPCPTSGGAWSPWTNLPCSDTCGLCGILRRTRTCLTAGMGCNCIGSTIDSSQQRCAENLCMFPRPMCCGNSRRGLKNRRFICVPTV